MKGLGEAYGVVGNHDAAPVNSFPPASVDTTISTQWAYDVLSSEWKSMIGSTAAAEVESNYGSYSVLTSEGLRLISVNTNFWYKVRRVLYIIRTNDCLHFRSKTSGSMKLPWIGIHLASLLGLWLSWKLLKLQEKGCGSWVTVSFSSVL